MLYRYINIVNKKVPISENFFWVLIGAKRRVFGWVGGVGFFLCSQFLDCADINNLRLAKLGIGGPIETHDTITKGTG